MPAPSAATATPMAMTGAAAATVAIAAAPADTAQAVKAIAERADMMFVIGAPNSSNSLRLAEVAERNNVPARLIERASDVDFDWLGSPKIVGITAGASAPEVLVRELVDQLATRFAVTEEEVITATESMVFKLPRTLTEDA